MNGFRRRLARFALIVALPLGPACDRAAPADAQTAPGNDAPPGMVWVPAGEFWMGGPTAEPAAASADESEAVCHELVAGFPDAQPAHRVRLDGFWIDATEVTNEQFEELVQATGYKTVAETAPSPEEFPGVPKEALVAGSVVFAPPTTPVDLRDATQWWSYVPGADWRHPLGPGSSIAGLEKFPVVHVAYDNALAYAKWAGKHLPTEAEWEYAARGSSFSGQLEQGFTRC